MSSDRESRPEFAFINWVQERSPLRREVLLGIGDDAAILAAGDRETVVTVDVITAGVHFDEQAPWELVGRKALAVNLSDIAAMAAEPCAAFVGIVLPRNCPLEQAQQLYKGLFELAAEWQVVLAGGDTNSWDGPLVISVTLTGLVEPGQAVRRDGAQPGDWILVTGALGGSLNSGRHLRFSPRVREARQLQQYVALHAMLDLSDGLGSDLFHILDRSKLGAILEASAIPIHPDVPASLTAEERLQHALGDGEDFELLFTLSPDEGRKLLSHSPLACPVTKIGEITQARDVRYLWNGQSIPLSRFGWSHQFGSVPHKD